MDRIDDVMLADVELEPDAARANGDHENMEDRRHGGGLASVSDDSGAEMRRALRRVCVATLRGAVTGGVLRGGFAIATALMRGGRGKSLTQRSRDVLTEATRWAFFLGSFSFTFTFTDEAVGCLLGKQQTKMWRTALAGLVAGPTLMLTSFGMKSSNRSTQTGLATYLLVRALLLCVRLGNRPTSPKALRSLLWISRWKHADTLCMCIASSQVLYSWIMMPHTLPASYVKFLNKHGGKSQDVVKGIRLVAERNGVKLGLRSQGGDDAMLISKAHPLALKPSTKNICEFLHPGQSCQSHFFCFLPRAYLRALPVYVPIYVIPALLVHRDKFLKKPADVTGRTLLGIARSSLFLACYCGGAWGSVCAAHSAMGFTIGPSIALSAGSGLATLIEKKSRRVELAIYVLSRAIESFSLSMTEWRLLPLFFADQLDLITFSIASSIILHCYTHERDIFKEKYLNVFDWLFGNYGHDSSKIRHVRSSLLLAETETAAAKAAE